MCSLNFPDRLNKNPSKRLTGYFIFCNNFTFNAIYAIAFFSLLSTDCGVKFQSLALVGKSVYGYIVGQNNGLILCQFISLKCTMFNRGNPMNREDFSLLLVIVSTHLSLDAIENPTILLLQWFGSGCQHYKVLHITPGE